MLKGLNSDINVKGKMYHIQTEDWGSVNPFLVSRIFYNGAVLKSFKTSYEKIFNQKASFDKRPIYDEETLERALNKQHFQILDLLVSGNLL
jgi:hypothetical protein